MKCLLIRPGQQPEEAVISDDLQSIQRFLGGPVEAIPFSLDWAAILSNANGPFHEEAEPNRMHKGKMIYGPFLVVGAARTRYKSLNAEQMERNKDMFRLDGDEQ